MLVLDANILLEILEERTFYNGVVSALEKYAEQGVSFGISTLSVSNTFYLAEKHKISTERVEWLIENYKIFSVLPTDVDWALAHYKGQDFEDAIQIAAALREKCSVFMTLDSSLAKKYRKFLNIRLVGEPI